MEAIWVLALLALIVLGLAMVGLFAYRRARRR